MERNKITLLMIIVMDNKKNYNLKIRYLMIKIKLNFL